VRSLGHPFDAKLQEAVTISPVADPSQDGTVIAVIREGYLLGDDLLRPASVVVGRHENAGEVSTP
jgi:molecular chaperone GrpE (heat shock protein)